MKALGVFSKNNISIVSSNKLKNDSGNLNCYKILRGGFLDLAMSGDGAVFLFYYDPCPKEGEKRSIFHWTGVSLVRGYPRSY